MPNGLSSLASGFSKRDGETRTGTVFGIVVHTTGSGVVDASAKKGRDPLEYTVHEVYENPDNYCAHYVVGWDGLIWQVMDETLRAQHVGFLANDREAFLDGSWEQSMADDGKGKAVTLWKARWPDFKSPAHLFPGPSPNQVYVGIEMIPLTGAAGQPAPLTTGGVARKYTDAQHQSVGKLIADIGPRWSLPMDEVCDPRKGRLVGHEDLNPIERADAGGGWDPGASRDVPRFDWDYLRAQVQAALAPAAADPAAAQPSP